MNRKNKLPSTFFTCESIEFASGLSTLPSKLLEKYLTWLDWPKGLTCTDTVDRANTRYRSILAHALFGFWLNRHVEVTFLPRKSALQASFVSTRAILPHRKKIILKARSIRLPVLIYV